LVQNRSCIPLIEPSNAQAEARATPTRRPRGEKRVLWHVSQAVRAWLQAHKRRVKREGGHRIVVCPLLSKSPWLNRIEPKGVHGKRAIAEPARKLGVDELKHWICAYYDGELLDPIAQ
jgi:hypothetical protein